MDEKGQGRDIWKYFNLAFELYRKNIDEPVLKYAIQRIEKYKIYNSNWELFQSLILKCIILDPTTIKNVIKILVTYPDWVNTQKLEQIVSELLDYHYNKDHSYEISWTLWLAKTFNVKINTTFAKNIFASNDVIPIILALHLRKLGLIDSSVSTLDLVNGLTQDSLHEEKWLLTYESIIKGWLQPVDSNLLDNNPYFKILKENSVTFYDESKDISPVDFVEEYTDSTDITNNGSSSGTPDLNGIFFGFDDYE